MEHNGSAHEQRYPTFLIPIVTAARDTSSRFATSAFVIPSATIPTAEDPLVGWDRSTPAQPQ